MGTEEHPFSRTSAMAAPRARMPARISLEAFGLGNFALSSDPLKQPSSFIAFRFIVFIAFPFIVIWFGPHFAMRADGQLYIGSNIVIAVLNYV